ncbi:MAG: CRISPR-associated helicase Cas3', partial [Acidobacteria bacterium]
IADYLPDQQLSLEKIEKWINSFLVELKQMKPIIREFNKSVLPYLKLNLIFSLLLDADKSDVVVRDPSFFRERPSLNGSLVDVYKSKFSFPETPINHLREGAYKEVTQRAINTDERIYSLNLPTGLGKTLTALSFALKLREKLSSGHRIIYTLPFLSIIDQNSAVFEQVLQNNGIEISHKVLLKHHHLSEISYKTPDTEYETTQAKILIEGWNSEIIVTTFVQLFESLISNKNRNLRKFHRIANSIIILDEVQSIPIKYWRMVSDLFYDLTKYFNVYVILVTATEPLIFDREKLVNLVDKQYYFRQLDRIYIKPRLKDSLTLEELASQLQEFVDEQKSYLFIFNTISAAEKFYGLISERYGPTTFLSTHVIPRERLDRINAIRKGQYRIVVSTQLVEAGVDIDFDVVVRDMAPLDSIIQSAGRCNRNSKNPSGKGEVLIFSLKNDRERYYHSYIYDPILTDVTRKILENHDEIPES